VKVVPGSILAPVLEPYHQKQMACSERVSPALKHYHYQVYAFGMALLY
jgi:hypothetical protein